MDEVFMKLDMEQNTELELAWQLVEQTGMNLFLTGKAGTGKTTFLRRLREQTPKRMVVLAPTGIAAINAGGVTIHSFLQLPFAPFIPDTTFQSSTGRYFRFGKEKRNIIRSMDLLVIDEISMVRADLLDVVDAVLRLHRDRNKPFGGVQLLLIGDLQQLPPVVKDDEWELLKNYYETPYFFASHALRRAAYVTIELTKVYRQSDPLFLSLLNKIRENRADDEVLHELNKRHHPGFLPPKEEGYIRLTTHNHQAQQVNDRELALLPGRAYSFRAQVTGAFPESSFPADEVLVVKEGAQIMFLKNDVSAEKRYYNGMIGEVAEVGENGIRVRAKRDDASVFDLMPEEWANTRYLLNEESKEISEVVDGTFKQYPIRLAWAITIHKSQGLTFERVIINARNSFAHGQAYVALSRCKSLEGIILETPLRREAIISDTVVEAFTREVGEHTPDAERLRSLRQAYFIDLLTELFGFYPLEQAWKRLVRLMDEELYRLYPKQLEAWKALQPNLYTRVVEVASRFRNQYTRMVNEQNFDGGSGELQERIGSAARYFLNELKPLRELVENASMPLDNKELKKQLAERMQTFEEALALKEALLEWASTESFTVKAYLSRKAKAMLVAEEANKGASRTRKERKEGKGRASSGSKAEMPTDIMHPELYRLLVEWRAKKAKDAGLPAYTVMQQKALLGIANLLPDTPRALEAIPYFGARSVAKYGFEILSIVRRYRKKTNLPSSGDSLQFD